MVDLGFLLITFFVFTTSMSETKAMKLRLPADSHPADSSLTAESKTLNVLLLAHDRAGFYTGNNIEGIEYSDYNGIRGRIIDARKKVASLFGDAGELMVLIKPLPESSYRNVVRLLDEMVINQVSRYVVMDPSAAETAKLSP